MILQYCSDLHLEFPDNYRWLRNNPITPLGDTLILAGDIIPFAAIDKCDFFFDYISKNFKTTYWIPGNHEYYGADISQRAGQFKEIIRHNVFLINNTTVEVNDTRVILSTLWSLIDDNRAWKVENSISDFKQIKSEGKPLSVADFNRQHQNCLSFVSTELEKKWTGKTIVATHHVPTFQHYPRKYVGSELNQVFAVELISLIEKTAPDYWLYGHHHFNTPAFKIGDTTLLTNQLGYIHHRENISFDDNAHIAIGN